MIRVGMRVVRGPNWKWGEQDTGEGHVGTIIKYDSNKDSVSVAWKRNLQKKSSTLRLGIDSDGDLALRVVEQGLSSYEYRAGKDSEYDLRLFDSSTLVTHVGFTCDSCSEALKGYRFNCTVCHDYDLCTLCYMADQHDTKHVFTRFDTPAHDTGVRLSLRCFTAKYEAFDMIGEDWDGTRVKGATRVHYYRDHLAIIGYSQQSGVKDIPFLIGDRVIVSLDSEMFKLLQDGHGGYNKDMAKYIDVVGSVIYSNSRGDVEVSYEGCQRTWTINCAALGKIGPFAEGDRVYITTNLLELRKYQRKHCQWTPSMENMLGQSGIVQATYHTGNLLVEVNGTILEFSAMCCKKQKANVVTKNVLKSGKQQFGMMRKGHHVTRGVDWKWGNQDGQSPGVVTKVKRSHGVVHVKWDNGGSNVYRMGAEDKYDLKLIDPSQAVGDSDGDSDSDSGSGSLGGLVNQLLMAQMVHELSAVLLEPPKPKEKPSAKPQAVGPETSAEVATLRRELEDRRVQQTCGICMDGKRDAVFGSCGHGSCMNCARQMNNCPVCRKPIRNIVRVYD